ncbi:MAG: hypothetical protein J6R18_02310 [Kiritimatiellae bacterium]|nr:hypothetical protein [Kiritimatiellia bacterium]
MVEGDVSMAALSEERLKLEREAFELERARLESARARAEAELKLARAGHPFLVFLSVTLLVLVAFAGGLLLGISVTENRHQQHRDARLREALSQLSGFAETSSTTNMPPPTPGVKTRITGTRGDVSVLVIQ